MHVLNISDLQALAILIVMGVIARLVFRLIPAHDDTQRTETFTPDQVRTYDHELPRYLLPAVFVFLLGAVQLAAQHLLPVWRWLAQSDYAGYAIRVLDTTHLWGIGTTILIMGLTWYILPRSTRRPPYSTTLANLALWFVVLGGLGAYLIVLPLDIVTAQIVHDGKIYWAARDRLGDWYNLPAVAGSGFVVLGTWLFAFDVGVTASLSRRVAKKPHGYAVPLLLVAAVFLAISGLQGMFQALPRNLRWLYDAGDLPRTVGVTSRWYLVFASSVLVALITLLVENGSLKASFRIRRGALWILALAFGASYLAFVGPGLVMGRAVSGWGGINAPDLAAWLRDHPTWPVLAGEISVLAGVLVASINLRRVFQRNDTPLKRLWYAPGLLLSLAGISALVQTLAVHTGQFAFEAVPAHPLFYLLGSVPLIMVTLFVIMPQITGQPVLRYLARRSMTFAAAGITAYLSVHMIVALSDYAGQPTWIMSTAAVIAALLALFGMWYFGVLLWRASTTWRAAWITDLRRLPRRFNGPTPHWRSRFPTHYFLLVEGTLGIFGFPGLGWILSGQAVIGVPLALISPAIAWAVIPIILTHYARDLLINQLTLSLLVYPFSMMMLSMIGLWLSLSLEESQEAA